MTKNLFTFNPFLGVTAGIELVVNGVNPRNGRPMPPHIACGGAFVAIEKGWRHPPLDREGLLQSASLHLIEPLAKARPFEVLVPAHAQEDVLFCHIKSAVPRGVKLKIKPEEVRARAAVEISDEARFIIGDGFARSYLVGFLADNAEVDIWHETGHIDRLVRRGARIVQVPLSVVEIARERVYDFELQLETLNPAVEVDMKRRHGIIAAAIRLLRVTSDRAAEDVFIDILVEQIPHLSERLREEIRQVLLYKQHPRAGNFLSGWTTNVVPLKTKEQPRENRALALARKRRRAEEDRARTAATKGPTGGSQKKRK